MVENVEMHKQQKTDVIHAKLIAREPIIDPSTGKVHNDNGLIALNGYYESPFIEFDSNEHEDEILKTLILRFKSEYEKLCDPVITIKYGT